MPSPTAAKSIAKQIFILCQEHLKLTDHYQNIQLNISTPTTRSTSSQTTDQALLLESINRIALKWTSLYQQAPCLIQSLYWLPVTLPICTQRYLKTNILILSLAESLNISSDLVLEYLQVSAIRDWQNIDKLKDINRLKKIQTKQNLDNQQSVEQQHRQQEINKQLTIAFSKMLNSGKKSAYLLKLNGINNTAWLNLICHQYEYLDASGANKLFIQPQSEHSFSTYAFFSFICHVVNLNLHTVELTHGSAQLKYMSRVYFKKIDRFYLNLLYQIWQRLPIGSTINYKDHTVSLLSRQLDNSIILQQSGELHLVDNDKINANAVSEDNINLIVPLQIKQAIQILDIDLPAFCEKHKISTRTMHFPQLNLTRHTERQQLIQNLNKQTDDPIKVLHQYLTKQEPLQNALFHYASQLSLLAKKSNTTLPLVVKPLKLKNAMMMLGLNRLPYWLIRTTIESHTITIRHSNSQILKLYLQTAQTIAAKLSLHVDFIAPEQAKLLISFAFLPYFHEPNLSVRNIKNNKPNSLMPSTNIATVLKVNQIPAEISFTAARQWQQPDWFCGALTAQDRKTQQFATQSELAAFSLLRLSILSVSLSYPNTPLISSIAHLLEPLPTESPQALSRLEVSAIKQSLAALKLTWTDFLATQQENNEDNHLFNPIPQKTK